MHPLPLVREQNSPVSLYYDQNVLLQNNKNEVNLKSLTLTRLRDNPNHNNKCKIRSHLS